MVTRLKAGIRKPKALSSTRYPVPACFLAQLPTETEPTGVTGALKDSRWRDAMQSEFNVLLFHFNSSCE